LAGDVVSVGVNAGCGSKGVKLGDRLSFESTGDTIDGESDGSILGKSEGMTLADVSADIVGFCCVGLATFTSEGFSDGLKLGPTDGMLLSKESLDSPDGSSAPFVDGVDGVEGVPLIGL
jgi:hypothetical protein